VASKAMGHRRKLPRLRVGVVEVEAEAEAVAKAVAEAAPLLPMRAHLRHTSLLPNRRGDICRYRSGADEMSESKLELDEEALLNDGEEAPSKEGAGDNIHAHTRTWRANVGRSIDPPCLKLLAARPTKVSFIHR
jgi:hypothetical protein